MQRDVISFVISFSSDFFSFKNLFRAIPILSGKVLGGGKLEFCNVPPCIFSLFVCPFIFIILAMCRLTRTADNTVRRDLRRHKIEGLKGRVINPSQPPGAPLPTGASPSPPFAVAANRPPQASDCVNSRLHGSGPRHV